MLFNSFEFIFLFLPATLAGFYLFSILEQGPNTRLALFPCQKTPLSLWWLVLTSCFFYAWWAPKYLVLIVLSMLANFFLGNEITKHNHHSRQKTAKRTLVLGIALNLSLLAYFKYANFLLENVNLLLNQPIEMPPIVLPLAISFFSFQQIAYLVDAYQGKTKNYCFGRYALFVTFFPQLIAGPIVHHKEMMPQFESLKRLGAITENFSVGLTLFAIGLFKKVVIADNLSPYAMSLFSAADAGQSPLFFEAWAGTLAYTFQLYFDFSGYADMALGSARLFGITLPVNFFSPYKAENIIEFWRRWHITLSRFLRDYLYIPLGGNRQGAYRRYLNIMITMVLGGFWHGAGWNFLLWGALHGFYLIANHTSKRAFAHSHWRMPLPLSWAMTFLCVVVAWVFFRAQTLSGAWHILFAMFDVTSIEAPESLVTLFGGCHFLQTNPDYMGNIATTKVWAWVFVAAFITFCWPNTLQWLEKGRPALGLPAHSSSRWQWRPSGAYALLSGACFFMALFSLTRVSEFLYFQF